MRPKLQRLYASIHSFTHASQDLIADSPFIEDSAAGADSPLLSTKFRNYKEIHRLRQPCGCTDEFSKVEPLTGHKIPPMK
ncbi:hypothetical protein ARTHRO8AJ_380051 [Arthrobacter sp. 8AJ]|nr:hypothetical protein ARTHRO8AJ_380051 [Arthrobacter sp. 8AJ]